MVFILLSRSTVELDLRLRLVHADTVCGTFGFQKPKTLTQAVHKSFKGERSLIGLLVGGTVFMCYHNELRVFLQCSGSLGQFYLYFIHYWLHISYTVSSLAAHRASQTCSLHNEHPHAVREWERKTFFYCLSKKKKCMFLLFVSYVIKENYLNICF